MAVVNGTKGNDTIFVDGGNDVVKAGNGNDYIYAGAGNDVITGGSGVNTIDFNTIKLPFEESAKPMGHDIVNLTKGETLTLDCTSKTAFEADIVGKDVVVSFNENESITLKNFASKDVVGSNGSVNLLVSNPDYDKDDATKGPEFFTVDLKDYLFAGGAFNKKGAYSGSWLSEDIDASYLNSQEVGFGKKGINGVNVKGNNGDDSITGSKFNDTLYGGNHNDTVNGGAGNDVITGGKGENTIIHHTGDGNDVINLTKGEQLILKVDDYYSIELSENKKDVLVYTKEDFSEYITIKNLGSNDVTNDATKKKEDESSVILQIVEKDSEGNENVLDEQDLRTFVYEIEPEKNYTGTWLNEDIDATNYIAYDKKGEEIVNNKKGLSLNGGVGEDIIAGSKYNDTLNGGKGEDELYGNAGDDKMYGGDGYDYINGGDGNDLIKGEKGESWLVGGAGNDTIEGGSDYDYIQGGADADLIKANNGDDYIEGDEGADTIYGGDGSDTIVASTYLETVPAGVKTVTDYYNHFLADENAKTIDGGKGNDVIWGSAGADTIKGGDGNDKLYVFGENSVTYAGSGDDLINLYAKTNKTLYGEKGNDTISIEYGSATVEGGAGNDSIWGGFVTESDLIFKKGSGHDLYQYRGALKTNTAGDTTVNADTLVFENISTSALSFNQDGDNLVISYGKNDSVTVKDYYKYLGTDDLTYENNNGSYLVESGKWEIYIQTKDGGKELLSDVLASYENGYIGTSKSNLMDGTDGGDLMFGYAGNDAINGGKGADTIYGGDGHDKIFASSIINPSLDYYYSNFVKDGSANFIDGGAGNDTICSSDSADTIYGGKGNDSLEVFGANSVTYGGDGNDEITLYYNSEKVAYGDKGNDFISLEYGKATVYGGAGNDTIEGGLVYDSNIVFRVGDGNDFYRHRGPLQYSTGQGGNTVNAETLVFEDASLADLSFAKKGQHLVIKYGKNSSVTVENYYKYLNAEGDALAFADERGNTGAYFLSSDKWEILIQTKDAGKILLSDLLNTPQGAVVGSIENDTISTKGVKADVVYSYAGNDSITTGMDDDTVYAGEGNDYVDVGKGTDVVYAGAGNDTIVAVNDDNVVYGEDGDDYIQLGAGNNRAYGGAGEDVFEIDGNEVVDGGADNDTFNVYSDGALNLTGGDGNDTLNLFAVSKDDLNIVFNIDKDGNIDANGIKVLNDESLALWKAGTLTTDSVGVHITGNDVEVIKAIDNFDYNYSNGYLVDNGGYQITSTDISTLKENVVSWLSGTEFTDVQDALANGNDDQVAALMAVFETANWQQYTV